MYKKVLYITAIIMTVIFTSCEEEITQKLSNELNVSLQDDIINKVVVEGRITNQDMNQVIRLTNSDTYFANHPPNGTEVANVQVLEIGSGSSYRFVKADTGVGYFISDIPFKGKSGEIYELSFEYGNDSYNSRAILDTVPKIDSIRSVYTYLDFFGGAGFYQIQMSAFEPEPIGNHYMFWLYVNDTLYNDELRLTSFADDLIINGKPLININVYALPQEEIKSDTNVIRLEMLSISRDEFNFINAFLTETQGNGNMFSGPPADIPTNIKNLTSDNDGLGFFSASSIASKEIVLYKEHADSTNNPDYVK